MFIRVWLSPDGLADETVHLSDDDWFVACSMCIIQFGDFDFSHRMSRAESGVNLHVEIITKSNILIGGVWLVDPFSAMSTDSLFILEFIPHNKNRCIAIHFYSLLSWCFFPVFVFAFLEHFLSPASLLNTLSLDLLVQMTILSKGFVEGSFPDELMEVLQSVASDLGDVVDDMGALQLIRLKGAFTNEVYQISWPTKNGDPSKKILLRVYGDGVEVFFNRNDEIRTFECMSKHGQGPKLLGRFSHGRLEEFIHARTLSAADLRNPEISVLIAAKMREFHNLDMPGPKNILLWSRIRDWIRVAKSICSPKDAEDFRLSILEGETNMLEKQLSQDHQEIGFCHNDLQYGNIMMDDETKAITIIDYEFASYNPVAYDIANHFCEMTFDYHCDTPHIPDYSKYPDLQERRRFIHAYLSSAGNQTSEAEIEQLLQDAEMYTLASHLLWGVWGIISGYVNKIDFDYLEYARQRFRQYWLNKPMQLESADALPCNKCGPIYT